MPVLEDTAKYEGIVSLSTTHDTMLIRLLVRQNTTQDLNIIHAYQNASSLTPIPYDVSLAPPLQAIFPALRQMVHSWTFRRRRSFSILHRDLPYTTS